MFDDLSNIINLYNAGFYGSFPGKQNDIFSLYKVMQLEISGV